MARITLLLTIALALLPSLASAGKGISGITVQLNKNLTSVGVRAIVSGDDDSSAVLRIRYRVYGSAAAYDTGMTLIRRVGSTIHCGRILWLTPGTRLQYYVEGIDAGGNLDSAVDTTSARGFPAFVATGPVYYVSKGGSDSHDGLAPASALMTIAAARAALRASADAGANGGIVIIGPGTWHEGFQADFGTDTHGQSRFLIGDGADRDSTILDGSADDQGQVSWSQAGLGAYWTTRNIWYTLWNHADSITTGGAVVLNWGERLHRKTSRTELLNGVAGELSGWLAIDNAGADTLFVRRARGASPAGTVLHASTLGSLIDIRKRNWHVANLTLRFTGNGGSGECGLHLETGSDGATIDSVRFYGIAGPSIKADLTDSCIVRNCILDGPTVGTWAYQAVKGRNEENAVATQVDEGCCWTIDHNTVTELGNGIQMGGGARSDSLNGSDSEITGNTVQRTSDDAMELELEHAINQLVSGNSLDTFTNGVSLSPIWTGPMFVLYNTITTAGSPAPGGGFKLGGMSDGAALIAHNTVASSVHLASAVNGSVGGGGYKRKWFRNNILVGGTGGYAILGVTNAADTAGLGTNDFNWNLVDRTRASSSARAIHYWSGSAAADFSPASNWRTSRGMEKNGTLGPVGFADSAHKVFTLAPRGSNAIDAGVRIAGINTSYLGNRYVNLPDLGAHEQRP